MLYLYFMWIGFVFYCTVPAVTIYSLGWNHDIYCMAHSFFMYFTCSFILLLKLLGCICISGLYLTGDSGNNNLCAFTLTIYSPGWNHDIYSRAHSFLCILHALLFCYFVCISGLYLTGDSGNLCSL